MLPLTVRAAAPGPAMVTLSVIVSVERELIVPVSPAWKTMVSGRRPWRWRLRIACRSEPAPASLRLVTVQDGGLERADVGGRRSTRGKPAPRWSVVRLAGLEPALSSGLLAAKATVCVGPPLLASGDQAERRAERQVVAARAAMVKPSGRRWPEVDVERHAALGVAMSTRPLAPRVLPDTIVLTSVTAWRLPSRSARCRRRRSRPSSMSWSSVAGDGAVLDQDRVGGRCPGSAADAAAAGGGVAGDGAVADREPAGRRRSPKK